MRTTPTSLAEKLTEEEARINQLSFQEESLSIVILIPVPPATTVQQCPGTPAEDQSGGEGISGPPNVPEQRSPDELCRRDAGGTTQGPGRLML